MMVISDLLFHCLFIGAAASKFSIMKYRDDFRTHGALIFENCENNYENVILHDELNRFSPIFFQQLHDQFHSITCYNRKFKYNKMSTHVKRVDAIIISVVSLKRLKYVLEQINKAVWWDVLTPVYILNIKNNNCDFAMTVLSYALRGHILTSYYPCITETSGIQVFTSNPFTRRAPTGWIEEVSQPNITFYRRKYDPKTICQGLHFDRSKELDGYEIEIVLPINNESNSLIYLNDTKSAQNNSFLMKRHHEIFDALITRLNVTVKLNITNRKKMIKEHNLINKNGKEDNGQLIEELQREGKDLILFNVGVKFLKNRNLYIETYPLAWEAMGIATYNRGHKTIGEKIWNFYGIWTILFTIIVLMVTFAVVWFSESRRTAFAVFEVIRLLISHNLHTRMNTLPLRIFFITVLIYFLIIQATFNGHLAKFLTHPDLRKNVETLRDLNEFGYTNDKINFPMNISIKKMDSPRRAQRCLRKILLNNSIACVLDHASLLYYSRDNEKLYVSRKPSADEYYAYIIRRNAYLIKRMNLFFMSLEDFGFRYMWSEYDSNHHRISNSTVTNSRSNEDFHPITLEHLMFSFWILAIGLTSATISFCVEVFITEKSKWSVIPFIKNVKNRILEIGKRIKMSWPRKIVVFFRKK